MDEPSIIESISSTRVLRTKRFGFLYLLLIAVAGSLLLRGFTLQVLKGSSFRAQAEGNRVAIELTTAPRGIMYDSRGTQLVENVASTDAILDPLLLPTEDNESPLIEHLPQFLSLTPEQIREKLAEARKSGRVTVLQKALEHDTVLRLEEARANLPGVRLSSSLVRKYPFERALAHVGGYTSAVSAEELDQPRSELVSTDITGKIGLEKQYDALLRGTHGLLYQEVDAEGRPRKELGSEPVVAGSDLKLGLDIELQQYIYQLLYDQDQVTRHDRNEPTSGAVVVLDPTTGSIRSLVSFPSFDPNVFSQPSMQSGSADVIRDEMHPLYNRAIDGTYPPGSTIKPLIAAAALEEGVITPATTVESIGGITIGEWQFPDWKAGGHGTTEVTKAIAESVNTFFYLASGGDETHTGLGVKKITKYLAQFKWGEPTGIDLPSEASGFLPSPEWKEKTKHERWYIGDTYHLGIGQGDVLATPLQIAAATATVANNGKFFAPHLVEETAAPGANPQKVHVTSEKINVRPTHLRVVRSGMRRTVTEGSGRQLADIPIALAGKTGTAQIGGTDKTHAWFTSYGPYEQPSLVVTVLLEKGGEGDKDAVPLAKNIWKWWYEHRVKPQ